MNSKSSGGTVKHYAFKRFAALSLAAVIAAGGVLVTNSTIDPFNTTAAAHALSVDDESIGLGNRGDWDNWIGQFRHSSGHDVFCLEMVSSARSPRKTTNLTDADFTVINATGAYNKISYLPGGSFIYPGISAEDIKKISVISSWYLDQGHRDHTGAASAQMAIWKIAGNGAGPEYWRVWNKHLNTHAAFVQNTRGHSWASEIDGIIARATEAVEAENNAAQSVNSVNKNITVHSTGGYEGTATAPKGATRLTIKNGVFVDETGAETTELSFGEAGLSEDKSFLWKGRPTEEDGWNKYYRVEFAGSGQHTYSVTGDLYATTEPAFQSTIKAPQPKVVRTDYDLNTTFIDPNAEWQPVLTTQTPSEFVKHGEKFADTVTFDVAPGTNEWRWSINRNGEKRYAPITATGTLYGPFLSDPKLNPSDKVPNGAPKVGTTNITTDTRRGPGEYPVTVDWVAKEAGYYTWVWDIKFDEQDERVKNPRARAGIATDPALPAGYFFTDGFGRATEGQTTPTRLDFNTTLSSHNVAIGDSFTDQVDVALERGTGGWLQDDNGNRIEAVLRGKMYYSETEPVQSATIPDTAVQVGDEVIMTTNEPGKVQTSEPFTVPLESKPGYISVVWCVLPEDQPEKYRGRIAHTCDDYGVPSETLKIEFPKVSTQAVTVGALKGNIRDTALVEGYMPNLPARVKFEAFMKPEAGAQKVNENWEPVVDGQGNPVLWTQEELDALDPAAVCEVQKIAETAPVDVAGVGTYQSPEVVANTAGTVYWVETLEIEDPKDRVFKQIHRGKCGLPNETTVVMQPTVKSQALETVPVGGFVTDTALVSGLLSDREEISYDVTFKAFNVTGLSEDKDGAKTGWCTPERLVFESSQPTPVTGVGEYTSEQFATSSSHVGTLFWSESLWMNERLADGTVQQTLLHTGECGAENETSEIVKPLVTSRAVEKAVAGDLVHDVAIVSGQIASREGISHEVTFKAFNVTGLSEDKDGAKTGWCTPERLAFESKTPTPVTGVGEFKSENFATSSSHVGTLFWVETLWQLEVQADGTVSQTILHTGECGAENETTEVTPPPPLAVTGGASTMYAVAGALAAIAAGLVIAGMRVRSKLAN